MCTTPISQNSEAGGWQGLPPLSSLRGADAQSARFAWLFPNTAINVTPNHAFIILTRPEGPGQTSEQTFILAHPESLERPGADRELDQLASFWDLVNRQDMAIVERVQAGLADPSYRGGRLCYHFEEPLHRFQNMVIDKMVGIERVPVGDEQDVMPMFGAKRAHT
jgi:choline monooxygenase